MNPNVQVAIDTTTIEKALELAEVAVSSGADWLEVGNPLIKFEGVHAIKALAEKYPDKYILVDFMLLAGTRKYIQAAKDLGAHNVTVCGLIPEYSIQAAINEGKEIGIDITVDLFNVEDLVGSAKRYEEMGADYVMVHFGIDQKKHNPDASPLNQLREVVKAVSIPVAFATYSLEESIRAVEIGASVIVQGEPLLSATNAREQLTEFIAKTKNAYVG
jgi:3-hexulose-6-phosphate synthase